MACRVRGLARAARGYQGVGRARRPHAQGPWAAPLGNRIGGQRPRLGRGGGEEGRRGAEITSPTRDRERRTPRREMPPRRRMLPTVLRPPEREALGDRHSSRRANISSSTLESGIRVVITGVCAGESGQSTDRPNPVELANSPRRHQRVDGRTTAARRLVPPGQARGFPAGIRRVEFRLHRYSGPVPHRRHGNACAPSAAAGTGYALERGQPMEALSCPREHATRFHRVPVRVV